MSARTLRSSALVVLSALSLAACEQSTAPAAAPVRKAPPPREQWVVMSDTLVNTFTVPATAGAKYTVDLGYGNTIVFPKGVASICDVQTSSYGPAAWNTACQPETDAVSFTVKLWKDASGQPRVDFQPSVRFVDDDANPVMLYLYTPSGSMAWAQNILYCPTARSGCYDESLTDPELRTSVSSASGYVYRRIKHFSGYNVVAD
jgi:hypothetical protein